MDGALIVEALRSDTTVSLPMRATKISRFEVPDATPRQPRVWTLIEFEAPDEDAEHFAAVLADSLSDDGGWYADLHTPADTFVVFAGRVFRYPRGDERGRAEAQQHARAVGVPPEQLDWAE
jgi:hypothetical protein